MLRNLTKAWRYLCFQRHRRANLNAYLYIPVKFFLLKGDSAMRYSYWKDDSEKFKGSRRDGGFDYIPSHMKVFLGNEHNSYIHTARNVKVTLLELFMRKL